MLILDIDNTILPSKEAYEYTLKSLSKYWKRKGYGSTSDFFDRFNVARHEIKINLEGHSSNRLRILYFKKMIELKFGTISSKQIKFILKLEEQYFLNFKRFLKKYFIKNKTNYKKVFNILTEIQINHKIIFLSNENLRTQLLKLESVFPKNFQFQLLVSEELGIEKPSTKIFMEACRKLDSKPENCTMIGDSLEDDISGASKLGLVTIHLKNIFGENGVYKNQELNMENAFICNNLISALDYYKSIKPV
ncbi:MAG: HAD family hydrolase [Leptospira sp.]|nr:HAD family hydrolase [Leptospira sp.]NCS94665.1 HAD family hydrolase [Leptospira sp.]